MPVNRGEWSEYSASAADSDVTVTHAAEAGKTFLLMGVIVSFDKVVTTKATLTIKDGVTVKSVIDIAVGAAEALVITFPSGLSITRGALVEATLSQGGSAIIGNLTLHGMTL